MAVCTHWGVPFVGVLVIRALLYGGLFWGPLVRELFRDVILCGAFCCHRSFAEWPAACTRGSSLRLAYLALCKVQRSVKDPLILGPY